MLLVTAHSVFCLGSCLLSQCFQSYSLLPLFFQVQYGGFMLRSWMQLNLSFVQVDKYGSIWIFYMPKYSLASHYLKMLSFFLVCICAFFIKNNVSIVVKIYVLVFNYRVHWSMCLNFENNIQFLLLQDWFKAWNSIDSID